MRILLAFPLALGLALSGCQPPIASYRSNSEIAQNFLDLHFQLENGRTLEAFSRFSGPITVRMNGPMPATAGPDLAALLTRLRGEAGLVFRRMDLVRMELLCELSEAFELKDDALGVVISLIDQLHGARAELRAMLDALAREPDEVAQQARRS